MHAKCTNLVRLVAKGQPEFAFNWSVNEEEMMRDGFAITANLAPFICPILDTSLISIHKGANPTNITVNKREHMPHACMYCTRTDTATVMRYHSFIICCYHFFCVFVVVVVVAVRSDWACPLRSVIIAFVPPNILNAKTTVCNAILALFSFSRKTSTFYGK